MPDNKNDYINPYDTAVEDLSFAKIWTERYAGTPKKVLTPEDHFKKPIDGPYPYDSEFFAEEEKVFNSDNQVQIRNGHFTRDVTDPALKDIPVTYNKPGYTIPVFSGATTHINPLKNSDKQEILDTSLEAYETRRIRESNKKNYMQPRISPLQPFTRMNPVTARQAEFTTYNRTKLPIADNAFRKGFRHVFFTRPECYIMASTIQDNYTLCEQCAMDEDFASCYSRLPHVLEILSPIYVTGSFSNNSLNSNWNYLLSNRVSGMTVQQVSLSTNEENVSKSISGFSVVSPTTLDSIQGATLDLKFTDTKNFEVYEMIRMWMLYCEKRHRGVFSPPYNGYQYRNGFIKADESGTPLSVSPSHGIIHHPYDRAEEQMCTLFDIVTDESMTKILYWCKYYGVYPVSVASEGLSNDDNAPLTELKVNAQFRYQYKLEGVNKTLVEFNYNAGITDNIGRVKEDIAKLLNPSQPFVKNNDYIGAAGMFAGTPYIVLGTQQNDPLNKTVGITTPFLRFTGLTDNILNERLNNGIENITSETDGIIGTINNVEDIKTTTSFIDGLTKLGDVLNDTAKQVIDRIGPLQQPQNTNASTETKSTVTAEQMVRDVYSDSLMTNNWFDE